jgi:glycolate oxidase iron-sulfur subunit
MQDEDALRAVAKDCVHCGFCLPACPTYQLWGEEMDSPRGRIHLVNQILDGAELTEAAAEHFDRCLGCMACMTACPSGVQYDQLIEAARVWTEQAHSGAGPAPYPGDTPSGDTATIATATSATATSATGTSATGTSATATSATATIATGTSATGTGGVAPGTATTGGVARRPLRDRAARAAIFSLFPYPRRLRAAVGPLRIAQRTGLDRRLARSRLPGRVSPVLEAALRLAPPPSAGVKLPERVAAIGPRRAVVGMLTGCVQSVFFPQVNSATARVLAAEGCDVIIPRGQGCCGALSLHSGREAEAAQFAARTISLFSKHGVDAVIVNSAGCGSAMKEYHRLLPGAERMLNVRDFSEFLAELGPVAERHPVPVTAAYHDACHLGHAQRITQEPRELLRSIPELNLVELADAGTCCGSAGVYNLLQPVAAAELGEHKADAVRASGAPLLISANPGCSLQIAAALTARGEHIEVAHTAQVIDASIRGAGSGSWPPEHGKH